jgi:hypothetical protein
LIRHASLLSAAPVRALPVAMIQPALGAPLVPAVGAASLLESRLTAAGGTAIALSPVAVLTDPEHRLASATTANPLPKNDFVVKAHAHPQAGLDNDSRSWQVRTSFDAW